jgi:hypothetical protein
MYEIDELDRVVPVSGFPQCEPGAPHPLVAASEWNMRLAYVCRDSDYDEETVAVVTFTRDVIHLFGTYASHNNMRHPLFSRGLELYGAFTVESSSLLRALQRLRAVGTDSRHYVLTFHDSIFECIANGFSVEMRPLEAQAIFSIGIND